MEPARLYYRNGDPSCWIRLPDGRTRKVLKFCDSKAATLEQIPVQARRARDRVTYTTVRDTNEVQLVYALHRA